MYDGIYLHLWKYELFNKKESEFEHKTHTARAILFPLIVWLLFLDNSIIGFYLGLTLVLADLIVLGIDAFSEKESRHFMGGLPKSEYIIHLFSNSLHFTAVILIIATRIKLEGNTLVYSTDFMVYSSFETVKLIAINILPGSVLLGISHVLLSMDFGKQLWNTYRKKIICC